MSHFLNDEKKDTLISLINDSKCSSESLLKVTNNIQSDALYFIHGMGKMSSLHLTY